MKGVCTSLTCISVLLLSVWMIGCTKPVAASPEANSEMLIVPGRSVGEITAGMTVKQVIDKLGEPQVRTSNSLEYTKRGFAVMPDMDGVVQVVMCGDVMGPGGPLVSRFKGKTAQGIGLGSTVDEVRRAYGPATEEAHPGGRLSMDYKNLGLTFSAEGGKVHHIIVRLGEAYQEGSAIPVDTR